MVIIIRIDSKRKTVKQSVDENKDIIIRCNNIIKSIEYAKNVGIYDDKTAIIYDVGYKQLLEYFR